jgi:hypothetical protein
MNQPDKRVNNPWWLFDAVFAEEPPADELAADDLGVSVGVSTSDDGLPAQDDPRKDCLPTHRLLTCLNGNPLDAHDRDHLGTCPHCQRWLKVWAEEFQLPLPPSVVPVEQVAAAAPVATQPALPAARRWFPQYGLAGQTSERLPFRDEQDNLIVEARTLQKNNQPDYWLIIQHRSWPAGSLVRIVWPPAGTPNNVVQYAVLAGGRRNQIAWLAVDAEVATSSPEVPPGRRTSDLENVARSQVRLTDLVSLVEPPSYNDVDPVALWKSFLSQEEIPAREAAVTSQQAIAAWQNWARDTLQRNLRPDLKECVQNIASGNPPKPERLSSASGPGWIQICNAVGQLPRSTGATPEPTPLLAHCAEIDSVGADPRAQAPMAPRSMVARTSVRAGTPLTALPTALTRTEVRATDPRQGECILSATFDFCRRTVSPKTPSASKTSAGKKGQPVPDGCRGLESTAP